MGNKTENKGLAMVDIKIINRLEWIKQCKNHVKMIKYRIIESQDRTPNMNL